MSKPLFASTADNVTADALMDLARQWAKRGPVCVAIFEWDLAPHDNALQFFAPLTELARTMLGPYAPDLSEALQDAREGDFAVVVHPVSLRKAFFPAGSATVPSPSGALSAMNSIVGIPVRELRCDPEWAPIIVDYGLADYGKYFLREDESQKEAFDLPCPLIDSAPLLESIWQGEEVNPIVPAYGEPLRETVQRIQDELHQAYRDAGGEPDA